MTLNFLLPPPLPGVRMNAVSTSTHACAAHRNKPGLSCMLGKQAAVWAPSPKACLKCSIKTINKSQLKTATLKKKKKKKKITLCPHNATSQASESRGNEVSLFTNTVLFKRLRVFQVLSSTHVFLMTVLVVKKIKMLGERALEVLACHRSLRPWSSFQVPNCHRERPYWDPR